MRSGVSRFHLEEMSEKWGLLLCPSTRCLAASQSLDALSAARRASRQAGMSFCSPRPPQAGGLHEQWRPRCIGVQVAVRLDDAVELLAS